jgi:hypothetical protein
LWKATATYTVHEFEREMAQLKNMSEPAHAYLEKVDPHGWTRAFFDTTTKCDLLMNGSQEEIEEKACLAKLINNL